MRQENCQSLVDVYFRLSLSLCHVYTWMDLSIPPTPPATQVQTLNQGPNGWVKQWDPPTRHEKFYYRDPTLLDPVILQVCFQFISSCMTVMLVRQKIPSIGFHAMSSLEGTTSSLLHLPSNLMTLQRERQMSTQLSSLLRLPVQSLMFFCGLE